MSAGLNAVLLSTQGNLADASAVRLPSGTTETTHYVNWSVGVQSGEVTLETCDDATLTYNGIWAPIAVLAFSGVAPKQDYIRVGGMYKAIRHRVSVPVTGGTVSSRLVASKGTH